MLHRIYNPLLTNSFFLFGARGTGKTYLLRELFDGQNTLYLDLLNESEFLLLNRDPGQIAARLEKLRADDNLPEWVIVDEIQRVPALLNEVHSLIESKHFRDRIKFALTGSSARKLKRGGANLLAGRALLNYLFPCTHLEWGEHFSLEEALSWGSLPTIITASSSELRTELLDAYVNTYIREEIRIEQIVRNLDPFLRFLEVAAQASGEVINYSAIGRTCHVDPRVVERYYTILEDTLLGYFLEPFHRSVRKRQLQKPKFLFFDLGVLSALRGNLGVKLNSGTSHYGKIFEHFIILELLRLNSYLRKRLRLYYYATHDGAEIDLLVERPGGGLTAVEIKSSQTVSELEVTKLSRFAADLKTERNIILSQEAAARKVGDVTIYPWQEGLQQILNG